MLKSELYSRRVRQFTEDVTVYPVSCEKLAGGRDDRQWLDAVLEGGARIVQLRDKESKDSHLLEKAKYFRQKTREAKALFLVNDRLDIALLSDADGMHVGQKDLPPEEIRRLAPDFLIGISCNCEDDVKKLATTVARDANLVSYFNIGPVYPTKTKDCLASFLGPDAIGRFSRYCSLPFTVMGGIKLGHIQELVDSGARRIAVVTAISKAFDIQKETRTWVESIKARVSEIKL